MINPQVATAIIASSIRGLELLGRMISTKDDEPTAEELTKLRDERKRIMHDLEAACTEAEAELEAKAKAKEALEEEATES